MNNFYLSFIFIFQIADKRYVAQKMSECGNEADSLTRWRMKDRLTEKGDMFVLMETKINK